MEASNSVGVGRPDPEGETIVEGGNERVPGCAFVAGGWANSVAEASGAGNWLGGLEDIVATGKMCAIASICRVPIRDDGLYSSPLGMICSKACEML